LQLRHTHVAKRCTIGVESNYFLPAFSLYLIDVFQKQQLASIQKQTSMCFKDVII